MQEENFGRQAGVYLISSLLNTGSTVLFVTHFHILVHFFPISDVLLYIYTSGTTGLPKAAVITNARYDNAYVVDQNKIQVKMNFPCLLTLIIHNPWIIRVKGQWNFILTWINMNNIIRVIIQRKLKFPVFLLTLIILDLWITRVKIQRKFIIIWISCWPTLI